MGMGMEMVMEMGMGMEIVIAYLCRMRFNDLSGHTFIPGIPEQYMSVVGTTRQYVLVMHVPCHIFDNICVTLRSMVMVMAMEMVMATILS